MVIDVILDVAASTLVLKLLISVILVDILCVFAVILVSNPVILNVFDPTVAVKLVILSVAELTIPVNDVIDPVFEVILVSKAVILCVFELTFVVSVLIELVAEAKLFVRLVILLVAEFTVVVKLAKFELVVLTVPTIVEIVDELTPPIWFTVATPVTSDVPSNPPLV